MSANGYFLTVLLTQDAGYHYSTCLLSCSRIPCPVSHEALRFQEYLACCMKRPDDVAYYNLYHANLLLLDDVRLGTCV